MAPLSDYRIVKALYESSNSLVYRAYRQTDDQPVILKMLKRDYPSPEKIAWFKREYDIMQNLALPGVARAYGLESDHNHWVIVVEDFGGDSLDLLKLAGRLALSDLLILALEVTDIVGQIHQQYIMHKDINPSNIVCNPTTGQVKIIDFGIATVLSREATTFRNPNILEGTLAYISPEQTGRMNRAIDYRTDFYSLGVTLYELLTGQLPFPTQDPLELIHCHIAQQPIPPHEVLPDIPLPISEIVLKLMSKSAEDRYQSAHGLKADLTECLRQWQASNYIASFPLGQYDIVDRFQIPQKLYGREQAIETLLAAFDRVSQGTTELALVSGYAGIGKTVLVQEVYKPLTRQRGYFIAGKFDQLQRNIPYAPLIQAFQSLIHQLLADGEAELSVWREKLQTALGSNGQVILEVIPEVELITGPQPKVPELLPAEAQNRFNLVFQNFIKVFTQPAHPLVIFLDDLQWADPASLKLIQLLVTTTDNHYLYLIGAYRDNEVSAAHPLTLTLDEIQRTGTVINRISLSSLELPVIAQFITDALYSTPEMVSPLASLVLKKTGGNPFFTIEFLKSLYSQRLLLFDVAQGNWRWDLPLIQASHITENLVELLAAKVKQLPEKTQRVLELAACIGNQFDLQTLTIVYKKSLRETAEDLWDAMAAGFILPLNDTYKLISLDVEGLAETITVIYKFVHDRIQQAVYSLIRETERQATHLQVGRLLWQTLPQDTQEQRIFDIVNHLNLAKGLIDQQDERDNLAHLNLKAGQKAKESTAYQAALNFLLAGVGLLSPLGSLIEQSDDTVFSSVDGKDCWQRQYDLTLALHVEAAEMACLRGEYEQMEQLTEKILQRASTMLDKARVYEVLINAHYAQSNYVKAMSVGFQALGLLDMTFPEHPNLDDIGAGMQAVELALADRNLDDLLNLPEMADPIKLAVMRIMNDLMGVTWKVNNGLFPLLVCNQLIVLLEHGNTIDSSYIYANYGSVLCLMGDFDRGYQFGKLALELLERANAPERQAKTHMMLNFFIRHWKEPLQETLPYFLVGYQSGAETGDLEYAAYCLSNYCQFLYVTGQNLIELDRLMAKYEPAISQLKQKAVIHWHQIYRQAVLNLLGESKDPCRLIGEVYDEEQMLPYHLAISDNGSLFQLYSYKVRLCYRFQEFQQALENLAELEKYLLVADSSPLQPLAYLYSSLTRLAVFLESSPSEQQNILEKVNAYQERMKTWAQHAPMNYRHKFYLVEAERCRVLGEYEKARDHYDEAIDLAQKNGYLNEESLAYELAARFYFERGQTRLAHYYLRDAHYAYQRWGAVAKVKQLEAAYPQLLFQARTAPTRTVTTTTNASVDQQVSTILDIAAILKAAQAIGGEIVLESLLTKMMTIVIEHAGASIGYLILEPYAHPNKQVREWVVEAEGHVDRAKVTILQAIPVAQANLPIAIINYTARTKKTVILNDALHEGPFTQDSYIVAQKPKSILCLPLINHGKVTGLLYLENNLTTGAFTTDRVEVLQLLAAQAAISLENARLYSNLAMSEEKYRSLFENAPIGMFEIDLTPNPPHILAANHQAEVMYGWSAAEFAAISSVELASDDARTNLRQLVESVRQGETVTLESTNRQRSGALFPVRLSARPETKVGASRMVLTVEDITAEKNRQLEVEAIEEERRRIAHEIHDGLAQDLAALRFKATLWHDLVDTNPKQMHAELDQLLDNLNGSLREVRRSIFALRPISLDELGFFETLRQFTHNFGEQYDLAIQVNVTGPEERLPTRLELPLFRIMQESLNNIRKHAKATSVQLALNLTEPHALSLTIRDDGIGFGPNRLPEAIVGGHVGLQQMSERIQGLKGTFSVHSKEGQGTEITVTLPLTP